MEYLRTPPGLGARDLMAVDLGQIAAAVTVGALFYFEGRHVTVALLAGGITRLLASVGY